MVLSLAPAPRQANAGAVLRADQGVVTPTSSSSSTGSNGSAGSLLPSPSSEMGSHSPAGFHSGAPNSNASLAFHGQAGGGGGAGGDVGRHQGYNTSAGPHGPVQLHMQPRNHAHVPTQQVMPTGTLSTSQMQHAQRNLAAQHAVARDIRAQSSQMTAPPAGVARGSGFASRPPGAEGAPSSTTHSSGMDCQAKGGSLRSGAQAVMMPQSVMPWKELLQGGPPEPDDALHDPSDEGRRLRPSHILTCRGILNIGTLVVLGVILLALFAGYPITTYFTRSPWDQRGGFGLGGSNSTGQIPDFLRFRSLIDPDTPKDAYNIIAPSSKRKMKLVFSDEFNIDGRSFYPGDDPVWEAADLHYWVTGNYEWYSPQAITTSDGNLVISFEEVVSHNLNFRGGMMSTWNKLCFTGGLLLARVVLPGKPDVTGLWPAIWTLGNLGRAGYGASTDGLWPYTYDSCDVGTLRNQTTPDGKGPIAALTTGSYPETYKGTLSYLPGQRLSACTCPGEDHPGPKRSDGSYVARGVPEIDIIEGGYTYKKGGQGEVSMSLQVAPFDAGFNLTKPEALTLDPTLSKSNSYKGGVYQQAVSALVAADLDNYERTGKKFETYGFEYKPGLEKDGAYVAWVVGDTVSARLEADGLGPNPQSEIGPRLIPAEPMYIIVNLGMSSGFAWVNFKEMEFPAHMYVDWVRLYQDEKEVNIGCDPPDYPTSNYIKRHWEVYNNPNITTWTEPPERGGYFHAFPKNRLKTPC